MPTSTADSVKRRRRRRTVVLAGGAAALLALTAACSSSGSGGTKAKPKLAFIFTSTDQNPFQEMAMGAKAAANAEGADISEAGPPSVNGPAEVTLFQSAVRNSPDGVGLETVTPDLFSRAVQQAEDQKVPLVAVDTPPPAGTKIGLFVGNSNFEVGQKLGEEFLKHVPATTHGDVVIGNDIPGLSVLEQRDKGIISVIKAQRPDLNVLGPFDSGSDPNSNYQKWSAIVAAHPNAIGYLGPGSSDTVSLATIEKKTGKKFLVGSCDLDPNAVQAVKDGYAFALVSPEHWMKGYVALAMLAQQAKTGKPMPTGWWNTGELVVNSANIDQIIARQQNEASRTAGFQADIKAQLADPTKYIKPLSAAN
jgi:ribose transport system substrate-binding protein